MNTKLCFLLFMLPLSAYAADIKTVKNSDGTIEFSNVTAKAKQQTTIYKSQNGDGFVFSDQKPKHGDYEVLKFDCYACNPHSGINWHTIALNTKSYANTVKQTAAKYDVDPALVRAIIHAESAFNSKAKSSKGAQGLMQLMPATARELGVNNALDAKQNIEGGVKYLSQLLDQFNGDIKLASAAYNAGPNAVKKYSGIPPYSETKVYVERVSILHQRYQNES